MKRSSYRNLAEINITSLVDVTLCLLIIFMITAPYLQGGVEVNLPNSETRKVVTEKGVMITVKDAEVDGRQVRRQIFFDEHAVTPDELERRLEGRLDERETLPIYLRVDEDISYGFAFQVLAIVERLGFTKLNLVADPPAEGAEGP